MGNTNSNMPASKMSGDKKFNNFYEVIDYIATYYILTMDFQSLTKLSEKDYCDKLVILTSDIISRYFNDLEVTYLAQRIKGGIEVNELTKSNVIFLNKDQLESLDVQNDVQKSIKKKRICIGIAKFYVKIAHLFAAIVTTINPVYIYKDANGKIVKTGLLGKDKIPKNVNRKLFKFNICDERIDALKRGEDYNTSATEANIHPKICGMNISNNGTSKSLIDEPGIPELLQLYLDDKYDYSNGTFTGMSDATNQQYKTDLKLFYTAFTGNPIMPPDITKFSDIKLKDYNNTNGCQGNNPLYKNTYTLPKTDKLFIEYANNIKKMIQQTTKRQNDLLSVINQLFTFVPDPYTSQKRIRVNPKLTEESLQKLVESSRNIIVDLYVTCENDYVNGIKIYESIVESKILETTQKQIKNLQSQADNIIIDSKKQNLDNKIITSTINLNPSPSPNPYPNPIPNPYPNPNLKSYPNPYPNPNLKPYQNPYPNPNLKSYQNSNQNSYI
jgi:ribosomal protein L17